MLQQNEKRENEGKTQKNTQQNHRLVESFRLEEAFRINKSKKKELALNPSNSQGWVTRDSTWGVPAPGPAWSERSLPTPTPAGLSAGVERMIEMLGCIAGLWDSSRVHSWDYLWEKQGKDKDFME